MVARAQVVKAVEELQQQIVQWEGGPDSETLPPEIVSGIRQLGQLVQVEDVSPDAYELVWRLDDFVIASDRWWAELQAGGDAENNRARPSGSEAMWTAWRMVREAAPPRRRRLPTPAILLHDQKVSNALICQKYGFMRDGRPDEQRLAEHLMAERRGEPSPHFDPQTWVGPQDRAYQRQWAELWATRQERLKGLGITLLEQQRPSRGRTAALPDIGDLAHQPEMTLEVLARKMRITIKEAEQQLAARGLILDGKGTRFFDPAVADNAKRSKESDEREMLQHVETYEDLGDNLEARVTRMAEDHRKPATIAKALTFLLARQGKPAVTYQQVQKILKESRETVEA